MATRQEKDPMPEGNEQLAQPARSLVEGFQPLVPPPPGSQSASHWLQHIYVKNGSPATFGHVVSKQWRSDNLKRRSTWAVVRTPLEVNLLKQDLISGDASDILGGAIDERTVTTPSVDLPDSNAGIVIVTFEYLVKFLSDCLQPAKKDDDEDEEEDEEEDGEEENKGVEWNSGWDTEWGNPTFVMNFAFGDMSFEMAFTCPLIVALIEANLRRDVDTLMACTVSNVDSAYFGWSGVKTQKVHKSVKRTLSYRTNDSWGGHDRKNSFKEMERLLSDVADEDPPTEGKRTLLLMDPSMLKYFAENQAPQFANKAELLREPGTAKIICVNNKTTYLGQVSGISNVVIFPYADGFKSLSEQTVSGTDKYGVLRSRAEMRYYAGCNQESTPQPQIDIPMRHKKFDALTTYCETSAAHNKDLARLLVCCKLIWPHPAFADMPVLLPQDEKVVICQIGYLCSMGILNRTLELPAEEDLVGSWEKQDLFRMMSLTNVGRKTGMLLKQGVWSVHSAHLLAQLFATSGEPGSLDKNSIAVREAVSAFSVLTEISERGETDINAVVASVKGQHGERSWYEEHLKGVAKNKAGRGPIWMALGIWRFLMHDYKLRGSLRWSQSLKKPQPWPSQLLNKELFIDVERSFRWDERLEAFNTICEQLSEERPAIELGDTPLTPQELLYIEVALVKAFMDRIMVVEDHGENFLGWDLASGIQLGRPPPRQEPQIWWESRRRKDRLKNGKMFPVFCIYSYLVYALDPDSDTVTIQAVDATAVSARSVRLAFETSDHDYKVRYPSNIRLVRDRINQASGGGS
ncbi:hypothetical protein DHEL01_v211186 [Diaporthe helianthi]|uniref:Uncharacterized protein n=1 Tax=Diaporthe helianthi TaxID=158607 RepID=A0A2P5HJJ5_DIAHE|nr:hypothetical protein DHEL01_v211186 [Diaporthe helianthi]